MTFEKIDFNELYIKQKELTSFKAKGKEAWDIKSTFMNQRVHQSIYNEEFLEYVDIEDCFSLLDVGCGVGNLTLRLAPEMENVYCLDYSTGMLDILVENAKNEELENIYPINKSWYDSWDDVPNADLVIASRSMEVKDMKTALIKLNNKANKRVVVSYKKGGSFVSEEILDVIGRDIIRKPDYIYLVNILYSLGINASVNFIRSEGRNSIYTSKEKFIESVSWSIDGLTEKEIDRLERYYDSEQCKKTEDKEYVYWAVIAWDKKENI